MKIVYLTAGAGGMYCGSCMHDNALAAALLKRGCDIQLVPLYTPIRTDEEDVSIDRVFFGGINMYLQQKIPLFRHLPAFADRWLNSPKLIRRVASGSVSVKASELGAMTLSMLRGDHGNQRKEVRRLVDWLKDEAKPEIINLTNLLIAGFVPALKKEYPVPVVVTLQGDDVFLEELEEPFKSKVVAEMRRLAREIDGFVVNSRFYAEKMAALFEVPLEKMYVVPLGMSLGGYGVTERHEKTAATTLPDRDSGSKSSEAKSRSPRSGINRCPPEEERSQSLEGCALSQPGSGETPAATTKRCPPSGGGTIGYLARICPEKGFGVLVDAFIALKRMPGMEEARLKAAGWLGDSDKAFFEEQKRKLEAAGLESAFEYAGVIEREEKLDFLRSVDVFSVPATYEEPKGLYVLEALECGVPVVQPAHGAFPELLERTGGGRLFAPGDATALARELAGLLGNAVEHARLGEEGRRNVLEKCGADAMAEETLGVYEKVVGK